MTQTVERERIIRRRFSADPYAEAQGFSLDRISDTEVAVAVVVGSDQANFHGGPHGGVIFSLADCAFSLACNAYIEDAVAIDTHMVFTAPSQVGDRLVATATEMSRGRTLGTYRVTVIRPDGKTVALFTGTVLVMASA